MTAKAFFTDPNGGIPYTAGQVFPHAHASEVLSALRKVQKALYRTIVQNWFGPIDFDGVTIASSVALTYDATIGYWAMAYRVGGNIGIALRDPSFNNVAVGTTVAATGAPIASAASSDLGCMVFGLAPVSVTANKVLQSNDGATWTLQTIGSIDTKTVSFIRWVASQARFIALVSTGEAYTSPDGVAWSLRIVPAGLTSATWSGLAVSSTGVVVATADSSTTYMTSADGGLTWTQRTGPTFGANVAYSPGVNSFAWGTAYVSSDGIAWTAMAQPPGASASGITKLYGVGPMFVAITTQIGGTGSPARVEISYDQANPSSWATVASFIPADGFGYAEYYYASENQIALVTAQSNKTIFYRSLSLGY
jgi:hypothetical protein